MKVRGKVTQEIEIQNVDARALVEDYFAARFGITVANRFFYHHYVEGKKLMRVSVRSVGSYYEERETVRTATDLDKAVLTVLHALGKDAG